jgi:hypothetical protein
MSSAEMRDDRIILGRFMEIQLAIQDLLLEAVTRLTDPSGGKDKLAIKLLISDVNKVRKIGTEFVMSRKFNSWKSGLIMRG